MDYRVILEGTTQVRRQMAATHQLMLSNDIGAKTIDADMKAFDKKLVNIDNAIHKIVGFEKKAQNYEKPSSVPRSNVSEDSISADLNASFLKLSKLQKDLKDEKYRIVDKSNNKVKALPNASRAMFTKAVTDIEEMIASL
jgi:primase-polymerase (primpol)-like protein